MRPLQFLLAVSACYPLLSCVVSQERYTRSRSAWEAEHSAHRSTARELLASERALAETDSERSKLQAETGLQRAALNQASSRVEEGDLDYENLDKVRDEQTMLLQELQSQAVLTEKQLSLLRQMLDEAQQHRDSLQGLESSAERSSALIRDLALGLHEALTQHGAELELHAGEPRVQLPRALALDPGSGEPSKLAELWLSQIAAASVAYPIQAVEFAVGFAPDPEHAIGASVASSSGRAPADAAPGPQLDRPSSEETWWTQAQAILSRQGLNSAHYARAIAPPHPDAEEPAAGQPDTEQRGGAAQIAHNPVVWLTLRLNSEALGVPEPAAPEELPE